MQMSSRRTSRGTAMVSIAEEIAHLRDLDLRGLRARWRSVFRKEAPGHLPRHLAFAILAYHLQADRLGDLDPEIRKVLDRTEARQPGASIATQLAGLD